MILLYKMVVMIYSVRLHLSTTYYTIPLHTLMKAVEHLSLKVKQFMKNVPNDRKGIKGTH